MTVQTVLTTLAIATITIFAFCFVADLASTVMQAWRTAATAPQLQPETAPVLKSQPKIASLNWVQHKEVQDTVEGIDIVTLAEALSPKTQRSILTLPQTEESKQLEEWLEVVPSPTTATPRPDYKTLGAMTVKKLRQEAKVRNVRNSGSIIKADLIAAILAA